VLFSPALHQAAAMGEAETNYLDKEERMNVMERRIWSLMGGPFAVLIAAVILATSFSAVAATPSSVTWTSREDFENNAASTGTATSRVNIDTASVPGDIKVGGVKDFVTTATITYLPALNKIYSTGVDRTTVAVIDASSKALLSTIRVSGPVAGIVYNSANNKLYVGQSNDNKVTVIDVASDSVLRTLSVGSAGNGVFASAYNQVNNKVYLANPADQTLTVLDGATDTVLGTPVRVAAGATTASFDAGLNLLFVTGKYNNYLTVIDGVSDLVLQDVQVEPILSLLGGSLPGNVGLRAVASDLGIGSADNLELSWNADHLAAGQNIQFQVRTAASAAALDAAAYTGPDGTAATWYDLTSAGASTVTLEDGTETTTVLLSAPFQAASELQLRLSYDGINSPVLHSVGLTYDLTITASAGFGGSITPSGAVRVPYGGSQSFSVAPGVGYHVADVAVDGVSLGALGSYTFSGVIADHTIAASFAINTYTISASAGPGGSISPASAVVAYGGSQSFTVTPDLGYHLANLTVDGASQGALDSYTFSNVSANHTIAASFAINTYTISASAGTGGSVTPASALVNYGGSQAFVITPNPGYRILDVAVDGVSQGALASYTFSNVSADHILTASFARNSYTITASAGLGGSISPSGSVTAYYGDNASFSFIPNSGCAVASVTVDGVAVAPANSYTFYAVAANHSISVRFTPSPSAVLAQSWSVDPDYSGSSTKGYGGAPDSAGNFYFSKYYNTSYVYRLNSAGVEDWVSSTDNSGGGQVATDNFGNVYSQNCNGYVYKFTPPGTAAVWTTKLAGATAGSGAWSMAVDNKGYLYVTTRMNLGGYPYKLFKIRTSDGVVVWSALTSYTSQVSGLVVDSQGKLYLTASPHTTVYKFDPAQGTAPVASFALNASYLAIDATDNIYASGGTQLYRMDTSGNVGWSVTPNIASGVTSIATDGVNVYLANDKYLSSYNAATGGLKQAISTVPIASGAYLPSSWVSTDGYGLVYVHSTYNSWLLGPITRFNLQ
jgi:YVTN family beta-propeller protein